MKFQVLIILLLGVFGVMFVINKNCFNLFLQKKPSCVLDGPIDTQKDRAVVTIYVHGTLFCFRNIFAKIPAAANLTYVPDGLTLVSDLSAKALPHELALEFCKKDPKRFDFDNFYAFGWSGKLSFREREKVGKILAESLVSLSDQYEQKNGIKPIMQVVTFSHGGNVALNMAPFLPPNIKVELIIIGCPIQPDTEHFALYDCFSKIYTIFSFNDFIQVVDPINICKNIKRKVVKKTNVQKILSTRFLGFDNDKIKQACVSVNGKYIGHLQLFHLFNKHVPDVLVKLDEYCEITGTDVLIMNIEDRQFPSFYGINVIDIVQGKEKC